jgi:hypothetical protein
LLTYLKPKPGPAIGGCLAFSPRRSPFHGAETRLFIQKPEASMSKHIQSINEAAATVTRREFTLEAALALLAGCVITISDACGDSKSTTNPSPAPPAPTDITGTVSANHGHVAVVTAAQITAANAVALSIQGTAAHNHTLSLSQADLQTLKNRQPVSKDSSSDVSATFGLHLHTVTFTPA